MIKLTVALSYAHDEISKKIVEALTRLLRSHGVEVLVDVDLEGRNPTSLPHWMSRMVQHSVVICVVSPTYVAWFDITDSSEDHKGVRYEARWVRNRLYQHTSDEGCPVIPLVPPGFPVDAVPFEFTGLRWSRFDYVTGSGVDELVERIRDAHEHALGSGREGAPGSKGGTGLASPKNTDLPDDLLDRLTTVDPSSPAAPRLVRQWLEWARATRPAHSTDLVRVFTVTERITDITGDMGMLSEVTEICLAAVERVDLDDESTRAKAKYLIHGRARGLRRLQRFTEALEAAEEGVELAREITDQSLVAKGEQTLGQIHRGLGELALGRERDDRLEEAVDHAQKALRMFASAENRREESTSHLVLARIYNTRYRLWRRHSELEQAKHHVEAAGTRTRPERSREHHELTLLRAEIAIANGEREVAENLLVPAISALKRQTGNGTIFSELRARAHLLRAYLTIKSGRSDVDEDVKVAQRLCGELELPRMAAECDWLLLRRDHRRRGLYRGDVRALETLCPDPVERLRVAGRERTWPAWQSAVGGLAAWRWRFVVENLRQEG
ncbi:TIR domain-containing protein [Actinosynnema sp. NPDC059797]